jgi:hypothetical protein
MFCHSKTANPSPAASVKAAGKIPPLPFFFFEKKEENEPKVWLE